MTPTPKKTRASTKNLVPEIFTVFGKKYGVEPKAVHSLLAETAFRQLYERVISEAEMVALLVVAMTYNLNPFTREIYALFDERERVVPVVGVDGWLRIINAQPDFDGMEFGYAEKEIKNTVSQGCPEWIECSIFRKDRAHPTVVREYLVENYRETSQWNTKTRRMLRHKTMIQGARYAFGLVGIFDPDEIEFGVQASKKFAAGKEKPVPSLGGGLALAKQAIEAAASGLPVALAHQEVPAGQELTEQLFAET